MPRAKTELETRSLAEWIRRIKEIQPGQVRGKVANLVWWDYFTGRRADRAVTSLDRFRDEYDATWDPPTEEVERALLQLGFPAGRAQQRAALPAGIRPRPKPESKTVEPEVANASDEWQR